MFNVHECSIISNFAYKIHEIFTWIQRKIQISNSILSKVHFNFVWKSLNNSIKFIESKLNLKNLGKKIWFFFQPNFATWFHGKCRIRSDNWWMIKWGKILKQNSLTFWHKCEQNITFHWECILVDFTYFFVGQVKKKVEHKFDQQQNVRWDETIMIVDWIWIVCHDLSDFSFIFII